MLIGRVAELTGATRKAIRHYESIGLIPEPERSGTYRIYNEHDVSVIAMIRQAQVLGFTLKELKEIVSIKNKEEKLPVDLACSLIDEKIFALKKEVELILLKEKELQKFKIDLVEKYA